MNIDPWEWITEEKTWGGMKYRDLRPWFGIFSMLCLLTGLGLMLYAVLAR